MIGDDMTKKKKKTEEKPKNNFKTELIGLLYVLISIIGLCSYGPVGKFIQTFAVFLVGEQYAIILLALTVIGAFMIIKRSKPKYFTAKLMGIYLFFLAFLAVRHFAYFDLYKINDILKQTWDNTMNYYKDPTFILHSGGMIGALLS